MVSTQKKTLKSSTYLVELEGSASGLNEPDLFGQLPFANESRSVKQSSKSIGPMSQSTMMSKPYQQIDLEELISSVEGSPVSLGVQQGSEEAQKMTVTSGLSWLPLLKSYNLSGSLARTCEALLTNPWASDAVYLTWKASGIKPSHLLFQLVPSTPNTDETECGLLHTPTAIANQMAPSMVTRDQGSWGTPKMWPTPRAADGKRGATKLDEKGRRISKSNLERNFGANLVDQVRMWPTPRASSAMNDSTLSVENRLKKRGYEAKLEQAVRFWPTPTATDGKGSGQNETMRDRLDYAVEKPKGKRISGSLNPTWVEWLMGFPDGWTDLKPSEMPSSHKSLSKSEEQ